MRNSTLQSLAAALVAVGGSLALAIPPQSAEIVLKVGDVVDTGAGVPGTISSISTDAYVDGNGVPYFMFTLTNADRGIYWGDQVLWLHSWDTVNVVTGQEARLGVSNTGQFIFGPSVNGNDAAYTNAGPVLKQTDLMPWDPTLESVFNSAPRMLPDGTAYWVTGSKPAGAGGSTTNRHFVRMTDPTDPSTIVPVFSGGDTLAGKIVRTAGSNFVYDFSSDGQNHIHVVSMETGSTSTQDHIYLNGAFVAQQGTPLSDGTLYTTVRFIAVNNLGNYLYTGTSSGPTDRNTFIAYNGVVSVREGDTIDGIFLANGNDVRGIAINNHNEVVYGYGAGTGSSIQRWFFYAPDAANLSNAVLLMAVGTEIDTSGNGVSDYVIRDIESYAFSGGGFMLSDDGVVYLRVRMARIGTTDEEQALLGVPVPRPPSNCPGDANGDTVVNFADISPFIAALKAGNAGNWTCDLGAGFGPYLNSDANGDGVVNFADISPFIALLKNPPAACVSACP